MPTWELLGDKKKKEYLEDARKAAKDLMDICEYYHKSGYCYKHEEACIYDEDQTLCPDYTPRYINKIRDKK